MAQYSAFTVAPRSYRRHQRHSAFARVKTGADQFSAFLATQATRLSSTSATIMGKLNKYTADRIRQAASLSQIP